MISKEKLAEVFEDTLAKETAKYLAEQLQATLQTQWNNVISELVVTRKSNERLKEALQVSEQNNQKAINVLADYESHINQLKRNQQKAYAILSEAAKEIGLE